MREAEHYPDLFSDFSMPKHELLEIYRSKISLHSVKQVTTTRLGDHRTYDRRGDDSYYERKATASKAAVTEAMKGTKAKAKKAKAKTATIGGSDLLLLS